MFFDDGGQDFGKMMLLIMGSILILNWANTKN